MTKPLSNTTNDSNAHSIPSSLTANQRPISSLQAALFDHHSTKPSHQTDDAAIIKDFIVWHKEQVDKHPNGIRKQRLSDHLQFFHYQAAIKQLLEKNEDKNLPQLLDGIRRSYSPWSKRFRVDIREVENLLLNTYYQQQEKAQVMEDIQQHYFGRLPQDSDLFYWTKKRFSQSVFNLALEKFMQANQMNSLADAAVTLIDAYGSGSVSENGSKWLQLDGVYPAAFVNFHHHLKSVYDDLSSRFSDRPIANDAWAEQVLDHYDMSRANFQKGVNLRGSSFKGADFKGVHFNEADLTNTDFSEGELKGVKFNHTQLPGAKFKGANLWEATFYDTKAPRADFSGAKLTSSHFERSELYQASLQGADLSSATIRNSDMTKAVLNQADLTGINLFDVTLNSAKLIQANLSKATLTDATLTNANLTGANLTDTTIDRGDFRGAQLIDITVNANTKLNGSIYDDNTQFPDNFDPKAYGMISIKDFNQWKNAEVANQYWFNENFDGLNLEKISIRESNLSGASMNETNLASSQLDGVYMPYAKFLLADLFGQNYSVSKHRKRF